MVETYTRARHLLEAIDAARGAVAQPLQNTERGLDCIRLEIKEDSLLTTGANGHILVAASIPAHHTRDCGYVLIDRKAAREIAAALKVSPAADALVRIRDDGKLSVSAEGTISVTETTDTIYPQFEDFLNIRPAATADLNPAELARIVSDLDTHDRRSKHRTTSCLHDPVFVRIEDGTLTLRHSHTRRETSVLVNKTAGRAQCALSAHYLAEAAERLSRRTTLKISGHRTAAGLYSGSEKAGLRQAIMPMLTKIQFTDQEPNVRNRP